MARIKLSKDEIKEVLSHYSLGTLNTYKTLRLGVYKLVTDKGNFLLKLIEEGTDIEFQGRVTDYLSKKGLIVQRLVRTDNDEHSFKFKGNKLTIFYYLDGKVLEKPAKKYINDYAKLLVLLHKNLSKLNIKGGVDECRQGYQFRIEDKIHAKLSNQVKTEYETYLNEINEEVNKENLKFMIIHGDIDDDNIIITSKGFGAVDWDSARWDYRVYDVAIAVTNFPIHFGFKNWKRLTKEFLKYYQKGIKLNNDEKKAIYYFIKHRFIKCHFYCVNNKKWARIFQNQLKEFNKTSLSAFLELF